MSKISLQLSITAVWNLTHFCCGLLYGHWWDSYFNKFTVSFLLNADFTFLYIHIRRGGRITIVSIGSQISCLFCLVQLILSYWYFMCFRDMQMDMEPYPKHWLSILIEWIVSSGLVIRTVSIITLKACKFLCYLFHSSIHFLTLHLYMVYLKLNKLHVAMFLKFIKFFYVLWYYVIRPFSQ